MTENLWTALMAMSTALQGLAQACGHKRPIYVDELLLKCRGEVESATPALPPDAKRCIFGSLTKERCINRRDPNGSCFCKGDCRFLPESKPAHADDDLCDIANSLCTYVVHRDHCERKTNKPTKEQELAGLSVDCTCGLKDLVSAVAPFIVQDRESKPAKIDWVPRNSEPSPSGEMHPNRFPYEPAPKPSPENALCCHQGCETPRAPGKVYCHEHYDELFNKPAPKPPPPTKGEPTTVDLPDKWGGKMPTAEEFSRILKEGYAAMQPDSPTCPARVRMTSGEKSHIVDAICTAKDVDLCGSRRVIIGRAINATESFHGIKP